MKMRLIVITAALVVFGATSFTALAADDKAATAKTEASTATQKVDTAQPPATPKKKPARHSHTQEKQGGSPATTNTATVAADTTKEATNKSKMHQHPRDAK
jgi:hypothetical protein